MNNIKAVIFDMDGILLDSETICDKTWILALKEFKDMVGPKEGIQKYFRECNKILNQNAAITMFDFLTIDEIKNLALSTLIKVREELKKE